MDGYSLCIPLNLRVSIVYSTKLIITIYFNNYKSLTIVICPQYSCNLPPMLPLKLLAGTMWVQASHGSVSRHGGKLIPLGKRIRNYTYG